MNIVTVNGGNVEIVPLQNLIGAGVIYVVVVAFLLFAIVYLGAKVFKQVLPEMGKVIDAKIPLGKDKWVQGVLSGISEYYQLPKLGVRVVYAIFAYAINIPLFVLIYALLYLHMRGQTGKDKSGSSNTTEPLPWKCIICGKEECECAVTESHWEEDFLREEDRCNDCTCYCDECDCTDCPCHKCNKNYQTSIQKEVTEELNDSFVEDLATESSQEDKRESKQETPVHPYYASTPTHSRRRIMDKINERQHKLPTKEDE